MLKEIFIKRYNNYSIYAHNLGKYDIYFILPLLLKYDRNAKIIKNKSNTIISITIKIGEGKNIMRFRILDSMML
jgi:hypothetical protein